MYNKNLNNSRQVFTKNSEKKNFILNWKINTIIDWNSFSQSKFLVSQMNITFLWSINIYNLKHFFYLNFFSLEIKFPCNKKKLRKLLLLKNEKQKPIFLSIYWKKKYWILIFFVRNSFLNSLNNVQYFLYFLNIFKQIFIKLFRFLRLPALLGNSPKSTEKLFRFATFSFHLR